MYCEYPFKCYLNFGCTSCTSFVQELQLGQRHDSCILIYMESIFVKEYENQKNIFKNKNNNNSDNNNVTINTSNADSTFVQ